jgi:hypothetical protein
VTFRPIIINASVKMGAPLEQREFVDLVMSYLPSMQAARHASVSRLWHEAVGRVHGDVLWPIGEAVRHGACRLVEDERGNAREAVILQRHVTEPEIVSGVSADGCNVEFRVVLQRRPVLLSAINHGPMKFYRPLLFPDAHERAAEQLFYKLTGQDVRGA